MPKTLYVSDLDGTLLTAEATLSDFTRQTLQQLIEQGMMFTVATSRSVASVQHIFQDLALPLPIIEVNGAYISDLKTGQHESVSAIAPDILPTLLQLSHQHSCSPLVSSYDGQQDHLNCAAIINDGMQWYADECKAQRDLRWRSLSDLSQAFSEQVVRFTFIHDHDCITALHQQIQTTLDLDTHHFENPYHPGWHWLTVQSRHSNKAEAIAALRHSYNLHDHELVVFGDQDNDLAMFKAADRAIAVENATKSLQSLATLTIPPHDQDSVAQYLAMDWAQSNSVSLS